MQGSFDFNTRVMLSLNRSLPYGSTGPGVDFFEATCDGDIRRLKEMASGKDARGKARLADVCFGGMGPLQAAARLGKLDVVRCMVEELGFDINHGSPEFGFTALSSAALDGRLDTVRYLLDNGADPNKKAEPGQVPLHCAAKNGHEDVARMLLSRGASVDIGYFHGTPLHIAAAFGKTNVMKVLLEHHADSGADVNSTDPDTPLVVATTYGLTDCIKYLLKAGANANIPKNCCGTMPIEIAAACGRREDVEMLFPFTSPIQTVSKWTVDGIIAHMKSKHSKHSKPKVGKCSKSSKIMLKLDDDKAVGRKDNLATSKLYGEVGKCAKSSKIMLKVDDDKAVGRKDNLATSKLCGEVEQYDKSMKDKLKLDGDKAVGRKDYLAASKLYSKAIEVDPADAILYSNRSFCLLQIGEARNALVDANSCIKMRSEWLKGYYRKGAALMSLKEYKEACDAFMAGLKLDPADTEMERMLREAVEAMRKDHVGMKNLESID